MKLTFHTSYSDEEMEFLTKSNCEILSEIKLSKIGFTEMPRRMIKYGGAYIAEICDEDGLCWAVLGKSRKGVYIYTECYADLQVMVKGL